MTTYCKSSMKNLKKIRVILIYFFLLSATECFASLWSWVMQEDKSTYYFGENPVESNYYATLSPYNRKTGRGGDRDQNCLYQYPLQNYHTFDQKTCAQDIKGNDFRNPKIRLRSVICIGGCFSQNFDINGVEGECDFFATPELINLKRICARIASPDGDDGTPADHGYTQKQYVDENNNPILDDDGKVQYRGTYLDIYGVTRDDALYTDDNGKNYPILRPKICAYDDPWALDLWTSIWPGYGGVDLFDLDINHQPFHKSAGDLSPIVKVIIFILQSFANLYSTQIDVIGMIVSAIFNLFSDDRPNNKDGSKSDNGIGIIYKVIGFIVEKVADLAVMALEQIGQINKHAKAPYGCINIPLGPYPPRYCQGSEIDSSPLVEEICTTNSNGAVLQSCYSQNNLEKCSSKPCVLSEVDNNFVHNAIRVGYQSRVPLCKNANSAECVAFNPDLSITRGSVMNNSLDSSKVKNNLISGSLLTLISASGLKVKPEKYYRILYETMTQKDGNIVSIDNHSYIDLPSCSKRDTYQVPDGMGSKQFCQQIWGVDLGDFSDNFIIDYSQGDLKNRAEKNQVINSNAITLGYVSNVEKEKIIQNKFYAQISENEMLDQVCAFFADDGQDGPVKISCASRAPVPLQTVTECNSSTHMAPCIKVNLSQKGQNNTTYSISTEIAISSFRQDSPLTDSSVAYLSGMYFGAYVTDDQNNTVPFYFSSNKDVHILKGHDQTIAHNSLFGDYKNNKVPSDSCQWDTCAKYLSGLEYIAGNYVRGGKKICILPPNKHQCPNDPTQCVKAKKIPKRDSDDKNITDSSGKVIYSGISTRIQDRITPPPGKDGYYDPQDADGTNCLNNKIKTKPHYAQISQCLPVCSVNSIGGCVNKFNLVDSTCSPAININSYLSSDIISSKELSAAISSRSFVEDGNEINLNITIDAFGNLVYTKTSSKNKSKPIVMTKTSINLNSVDSNITIINIVANANKIDQMATITKINPEKSFVSSDPAVAISGGRDSPLIPINKGTVFNNNGIIKVTYQTKTIETDPKILKISLTDSAKSDLVIEAFIDIDTGVVSVNHITTDAKTKVSNNKMVKFDPSTGVSTSSLNIKDPASGFESNTLVNPVDGVTTKIEKATLKQNDVTTVTTTTTITNPKTLTVTVVKNQEITTIKDGIETKITRVTDPKGDVIESPPRTSEILTYYCYEKTNLNNILADDEGVRNKIGDENPNFCVAVPPPPKCLAIKDEHLKTSWPEVDPSGTWVSGTCADEYMPRDFNKMGRQCILQINGESKYDEIDLEHFAGCVKIGCGMHNLVMNRTNNGYTGDPTYITEGSCPNNTCSNGVKFGIDIVNKGDKNDVFNLAFDELNKFSKGSLANVANIYDFLMQTDEVTNNFTIEFLWRDKFFSTLKFTNIIYNGNIKVKINGNVVYDLPFVNDGSSRSLLDPLLNMYLNPALSLFLKEGKNVIELELKTKFMNKILIELQYNTTCIF
jgi:hypothetical protein